LKTMMMMRIAYHLVQKEKGRKGKETKNDDLVRERVLS